MDMVAPRRVLASGLAALAACALLTATTVLAGAGPAAAWTPTPSLGCGRVAPSPGWVATWGAAEERPGPGSDQLDELSRQGFDDRTERAVVHVSLGGSEVRIHLSNRYGSTSVKVGEVRVGLAGTRGAIAGPDLRVTFGGHLATTVAAGRSIVSDAVPLRLPDLTNLAVSIFFSSSTGPATWHPEADYRSYASSPGDHAGDLGGTRFTTPIMAWYFLLGVDTYDADQAGAVVALGDSITNGTNSTIGAPDTWPDDLAARIIEQEPPGHRMAVVNAGIGGNRVLGGSVQPSAIARFDTDVAARAGVRTVILLEGVNDIGDSDRGLPDEAITAAQLIRGLEDIIQEAHARHLRILGATITPFASGDGARGRYYTEAGERMRLTVNRWIETSGAFDGVLDFSKALADSSDPARMNPADGGPLHPDDAGYRALAAAVPLGELCA